MSEMRQEQPGHAPARDLQADQQTQSAGAQQPLPPELVRALRYEARFAAFDALRTLASAGLILSVLGLGVYSRLSDKPQGPDGWTLTALFVGSLLLLVLAHAQLPHKKLKPKA